MSSGSSSRSGEGSRLLASRRGGRISSKLKDKIKRLIVLEYKHSAHNIEHSCKCTMGTIEHGLRSKDDNAMWNPSRRV